MRHGSYASVLIALTLLGLGATDLRGQGARGATGTAAAGARRAVQRFYDAFNAHGFDRAAEFTRDDWVHINPSGGVTRGRTAVLAELRAVHASFLKGVTDTPDSIAVRLATPDVAVATVPSRMSAFTTPDGTRHVNELHVRTFVVVRRAGAWRIMQDQNTVQAQ
ncbi:MAG TPA: SgcJ/EcaC family oxidoreductase [Gemmatimonadaceae bacterium]|nr:SgcJ/EcaC family oxidoreductase [Gemmatimonadaceae bacterium]